MGGDVEGLIREARGVAERAYAPYSGFRVSAVVVDEDGNRYYGVNVENSSYGLTVCAERVAVFSAVAGGARRISKVVVYSLDSERPVVPCGACLQVISEFGGDDTLIYMVSRDGYYEVAKLGELLPKRFSLRGVRG